LASIVSLILATCPNKERRLDWTMRESWGCCVLRLGDYFLSDGLTHILFHIIP